MESTQVVQVDMVVSVDSKGVNEINTGSTSGFGGHYCQKKRKWHQNMYYQWLWWTVLTVEV